MSGDFLQNGDMTDTPERRARRLIDAALEAAGWLVRSRDDLDLSAGRGIAVAEFPLMRGFGFADYMLYVDRLAAGAIEAKAGGTLGGVEAQSEKYAFGVPVDLSVHEGPPPFCSYPTARSPASPTPSTRPPAAGKCSTSPGPRRWRGGWRRPKARDRSAPG